MDLLALYWIHVRIIEAESIITNAISRHSTQQVASGARLMEVSLEFEAISSFVIDPIARSNMVKSAARVSYSFKFKYTSLHGAAGRINPACNAVQMPCCHMRSFARNLHDHIACRSMLEIVDRDH